MVVAVLGVALALLPNSQDFVWVAMALLVPLFTIFACVLYFARMEKWDFNFFRLCDCGAHSLSTHLLVWLSLSDVF